MTPKKLHFLPPASCINILETPLPDGLELAPLVLLELAPLVLLELAPLALLELAPLVLLELAPLVLLELAPLVLPELAPLVLLRLSRRDFFCVFLRKRRSLPRRSFAFLLRLFALTRLSRAFFLASLFLIPDLEGPPPSQVSSALSQTLVSKTRAHV